MVHVTITSPKVPDLIVDNVIKSSSENFILIVIIIWNRTFNSISLHITYRHYIQACLFNLSKIEIYYDANIDLVQGNYYHSSSIYVKYEPNRTKWRLYMLLKDFHVIWYDLVPWHTNINQNYAQLLSKGTIWVKYEPD